MILTTAVRHTGHRGRRAVPTLVAMLLLSGTPAWATVGLWNPIPGGPTPRAFAAAAWGDHRMLLFGGTATGGGMTDETWQLQGGAWTPVSATDPERPSPRYGAAMAFDEDAGVFVLFGGTDPTLPFLGDTYEWNGAWVRRGTTGPPRVFASAAYDPTLKRVVMFGGHDASGPSAPQTFVWDHVAGTWNALPTTGTPPARLERAGLAWDPAAARLVLYGGLNFFVNVDNAWQLQGGTWSKICTGCTGTGRSAHGLAGGAPGLYVFGGGAQSAQLNEVRTVGPTTPWSPLYVVNTPPAPRYGQTFVYDADGKRFVSVGGSDAAGDRTDVSWELTLRGNPCTKGEDCATGFCPSPEHVCCDTPCTEECHACDIPMPDPTVVDGVCRPRPNGYYPDECTADEEECRGHCTAGKCENAGPERLCGKEKCLACNKQTRKCSEMPLDEDDPECGDTTGRCTLANTVCRTYDDPQKKVHRCLAIGQCGWRWSDCLDATQAADGAVCADKKQCQSGFCGDTGRMTGGGCGGCGGGGAMTVVHVTFADDVDRSKIAALYVKTGDGEVWEGFLGVTDFTPMKDWEFHYYSLVGKGTHITFTFLAIDAQSHLLALGQTDTVIDAECWGTVSATTK